MKKTSSIILLCIVLALSGAKSCYAYLWEKVQVISVGSQVKDLDWPQGMFLDGKKIYVMDGAVIKVIESNKVSVYFDLYKLKKDFEPYGLNEDAVIKSFRLAQMEMHNKELYVSGLVFQNTEAEDKEYKGEKIRGYTYNLIIKIVKGEAKIIHISKAKVNTGFSRSAWFETESGLPEDLYKLGTEVIYDYAKYVTFPRFSFNEDKLVYVRQQLNDDYPQYGPLREVVEYKLGSERIMYSWKGSYVSPSKDAATWHYVFPLIDEEGSLAIYDGNTQVHYVQALTGKVIIERPSETKLLQRPIYRDGKMYFLTNEEFFRAERVWFNNAYVYSFREYDAEDFNFSGDISGYDFDGNNLYILDYGKREINKYNLTGIDDSSPEEDIVLQSGITESPSTSNDVKKGAVKNMLNVKVNGEAIIFSDAQPYKDKATGRVMVPIRFVSEALKAEVYWDEDSKTIYLAKSPDEKYTIFLTIGSTTVISDDKTVEIDSPPLLVDGRTFVPLRFVSEVFGAEVKWDMDTQTADIKTKSNNHKEINDNISGG